MFLGENIFKLVDDEFAVQRIPWKHCLSFGCGSASVTTGWKKGVISVVRQQHEHVSHLHPSPVCTWSTWLPKKVQPTIFWWTSSITSRRVSITRPN